MRKPRRTPLLLAAQAAAVGVLLAATTVGGQDSPFSIVSRQLVEEECPGISAEAVRGWSTLQSHFFEVQSLTYAGLEGRWAALANGLEGLTALMNSLDIAYQCPISATRHFRQVAEWALALGHPWRARGLIQMGNIFKIQAMARWWNALPQSEPGGTTSGQGGEVKSTKRFEPRMQVEYTIAVTQLHAALQTPLRPVARYLGSLKPRIEVHSICTYRSDPTSNTGPECPLPELSVPNHRAYAERHGYKYVLHTELPLPDREAHYSKMLVIHEALRSASAPDWVFFIDCDAFFTDAVTSIPDILETYSAAGSAGPHFLVAEDPGGINTGTLLVRRSDWSLTFLERVAACQFGIAWDQSMFFWEILKPELLQLASLGQQNLGAGAAPPDFRLPPEVAFVHQARLNGFVPPASRDWSAYEWQPGDFVRHFAGCPWQEGHCLGLMHETAALAQQQLLQLSAS
ncbi:unnamed protein product [Polarella glacialis]|uniref:Uncharacterized protein n=1 Tax=Polarella glacialis TaxID=89957 RepID=A0A813DGE7_POLGL|nr:unnamed protein product [Polarella glacialis]